MSERADQIVLEYLRRVSDASYGVLRSDERLEFSARLRRRIDEVRIRQKAHKPAQVQRIIDRLGAPETLVEEERLRLAAERPEDPPRPRDSTPPPAPEPTGADTKNPTVVTKTEPGAEPDYEHPFNQTQPIPVIDDAMLSRIASNGPADEMEADEMEEVGEEPAEIEAAAEPVPDGMDEEPSAQEEPAPAARGSRTTTASGRLPGGAAPADVLAISGRGVPGGDRHGDFIELAGRHKMASITIVLLGFGALAMPVPLWLLGVVLLVLCQAWPLGDKLLGAAVPILTAALYGLVTDQAMAVLTMSAYTLAGAGGPRLAFGIGGLLGAAFLGYRLNRTAR